MEALKKQNKYLNTRLMMAEACNSQRDQELKNNAREKGEHIRRGKQMMNLDH
jgi:hypothetical protein